MKLQKNAPNVTSQGGGMNMAKKLGPWLYFPYEYEIANKCPECDKFRGKYEH
ncbi:unnamed protein product, partial [Ilex paraguariensis]